MARCVCGNDSQGRCGFVTRLIDCDRCDNRTGYRRCGGCTRGQRDVVLKCCGACRPAGKIKCLPCNGIGKREIKERCTRRHVG
ncbi:hypothetical protein C8A01DRAFT_16960 [Parachaetomium inaequale]|uniref:Uncharacterized protein n=1 Tax=Parachaetomium inaequale TaxID=2588326 RepID=A0AAN6SR42_9PEZI|nr:hypothetical protein C8A01DRAFT_16960 [Parachaetomium inaequale]